MNIEELWFYRPSMKVTSHINYKNLIKSGSRSVQNVLSLADATRRDLLHALGSDPEKQSPDAAGVTKHLETYLSLLAGGLPDAGTKNNFLQESLPSSWSDSLSKNNKIEQKDVAFEYGHMLFNTALWLAKRAGYITQPKASTSPTQLEANLKESFQLLKTAAGMVAFVQSTIVPKLKTKAENFTDLDADVLTAYERQFLAEAQEVVLKRATDIKTPQSADVICPLAADTSSKYSQVAALMTPTQTKPLGSSVSKDAAKKFHTYAELKKMYWEAVSRSFQADKLIEAGEAGSAVRCIAEGKSQNEKFSDLAAKNRSSLNIVDNAFHSVAKLVEKVNDKVDRENALLYHQRAAPEVPPMLTEARFGIASAIVFESPHPHTLWAEVLPPLDPSKGEQDKDEKKDESSCSVM